MRLFDKGAFYRVQVFRREVAEFNRAWPCSILPDSSITFEFDRRNGDLTDILPYRIADKVDGGEAVALSQEAQAYALSHPKMKAR